MKDNYDFSGGEQGKFYNTEAEFSFPTHLDPDVDNQLNLLAEKNGLDLQKLVNEWLRANLKIIDSLHV